MKSRRALVLFVVKEDALFLNKPLAVSEVIRWMFQGEKVE